MSLKGLQERLEEQRERDDEKRREHREEVARRQRAYDNMVRTKDDRLHDLYEAEWRR